MNKEIKHNGPSANELTPFTPTHPGSILKEEIEYRGISQCKLAKDMGIGYSALNEILNERRPLTEKTALLFEAALGVNADCKKGQQLHGKTLKGKTHRSSTIIYR